jgi:CBS domain-containing protein
MLGLLLIGLGGLQLFGGAPLGGLWFIFIGWFLRSAAVMSLQQHLVRSLLDGVSVSALMSPDPEVVHPALTLEELVESHFLEKRHQAFPVVENGHLLGLVTLQHVKEVPRDSWKSCRVGDVMREVSQLTVGPGDTMTRALERMEDVRERRVLVVDDDRLVGIISGSDVTSWLQRSAELDSLRE